MLIKRKGLHGTIKFLLILPAGITWSFGNIPRLSRLLNIVTKDNYIFIMRGLRTGYVSPELFGQRNLAGILK